jgi:predicted methyltransferase
VAIAPDMTPPTTTRWRGRAALLTLLIVVSLAVTMRLAALDTETTRVVSVLALKPGMNAADVGAGSGEYTIAMAEAVGATGHVYATEIDREKLDDVRQAAERGNFANVTVIEAEARDSKLPDDCCDAILIRHVYHHFTDPEPTNATLFRALRPGGRLVIVDFEAEESGAAPSGVPPNRGGHGIPRKIVVQELAAAGFRAEENHDRWSGRDYLLVFRKPS